MYQVFTKIYAISKMIHNLILDLLFPVRCISCGKDDFWICPDCFSKIRSLTDHVCAVCEKAFTPDGRTCLACKKKNPLDGLISATSYRQSFIASAVHYYKYRFVQDLHIPLGNLLVECLKKTDLPLPNLVIPIPLHPRRLRWRGFNQSALLADHVAKNLLPSATLDFSPNILRRCRYTLPQMQIKKYSFRQENIRGAFEVIDKNQIKGKIVLLVDDIATTGSTIFECAKVLKIAGAREVFAIVVARQETKS